MDDPTFVRRVERVAHLTRDAERFGERDRRSRDSVCERLAVDQFQDESTHAAGFFEAVDRADMRVVQRREHTRFALEASEPRGIERTAIRT